MTKSSKALEVDPDKMDCVFHVYPHELPVMQSLKYNANFEYLVKKIDGGGGVVPPEKGDTGITVNGKSPDEDGDIELTAEDVGAANKEHVHGNATATKAGFLSPAEFKKLSGVEEQATKNGSDGFLLDRKNHTGVQKLETVEGLVNSLAKIQERVGVSGIINTPGDSLVLAINDVEIVAEYNPDEINSVQQRIRCKADKNVIVDLTYISTDGNGTVYPYGMDQQALTRQGQLFDSSRDIHSFSYNVGHLRENGRVWRLGSFFSQMGRECSLWAERVI